MNIAEFIITYWLDIIIAVLFAALLGLLYYKGHKKWVYTILYSLVTEAEKQFGGGTGELKQAYVIKQVYNALPGILKTFISAEKIGAWVDDALITAKEKWKKNGYISDYIEGGEGK
ncbi:MAG: hypothetical protein IKJ91_06545 [Clostridia bacterium]|nr:hypothetical protein [Clostridia bacterium]